MTEIDIPFNDWSKKQLLIGNKWATTRTKRYGQRGDTFTVESMMFRLTHVVKVRLLTVAEYFYEEEGCTSKGEFVGVWEDIHYRKGYVPGWEVWLHLFTEVQGD